jgi:ribosomal protein L3 glutamine methyltransferase
MRGVGQPLPGPTLAGESSAQECSMFTQARVALCSVRDLLRFAMSRFEATGLVYGHGSENPFDEAAYLILHTLHLPLDRLEPFLDARLLPAEVDAVLDVLQRRVRERLPAAYLTHEAWLGDFRFYVDERVIVPRSHIAAALEQRLAAWIPDPASIERALDLCTGSGCLAVLLAHAFPATAVDASDISASALEVARHNVQAYGLSGRVRLIESDLFSALSGQCYDVIVSNPPYVTAAAMAALPSEYQHEPALALAGGEDGLSVVRRILQHARHHLTRKGVLLIEVGEGREALESAYPQLELTWLEAPAGDGSVCLLERDQLLA